MPPLFNHHVIARNEAISGRQSRVNFNHKEHKEKEFTEDAELIKSVKSAQSGVDAWTGEVDYSTSFTNISFWKE